MEAILIGLALQVAMVIGVRASRHQARVNNSRLRNSLKTFIGTPSFQRVAQ